MFEFTQRQGRYYRAWEDLRKLKEMREAKPSERKRKGKEVESEKRQVRKEEGGPSGEKSGGSNEERGNGVMMTEKKMHAGNSH